MSDQPKVSERMERLVIAYALTVAYPTEPQKVNAARCALLSAIAEIEQRAEKAGASAETIEVLADVIRKHHADIVIADAKGEPKADDDTWVVCAINELGKQRERAEKWKEAAVAIHEAALCMKGIVLTKRVAAAFVALGDEWDEATR